MIALDNTESFLDSRRLTQGERLAGRFQIDCCVGAGGMGEVYRAIDLELDEVVAIKVMRPDCLADATTLRREVRLARSISSPNVARTFEFHNTGQSSFLVMEFIEGTSLAQLMQQQKDRPLQRAVLIARDVLLGLAAAHAAGVVHRDIKPANIMIRPCGRALVADFGLAKSTQQGQHATGAPTGTPAYMAPEQVRGTAIGAAADIFAVGVVLFEMLSGQLPWSGTTTLALALARLTHPPLQLADVARGVAPALAAWIMRAIEREPDRRWPNAHAAQEALAQAAGQRAKTDFFYSEKSSGWPQHPTQSALLAFGRAQPVSDKSGRGVAASQVLPTVGALPRIVVLPFRVHKLSSSDQAVAGLDEDLVTGLSGFRALRVLSPTAVAKQIDSGVPWQAVALALGATHVVEGAVRAIGGVVRINLRLVSMPDEQACWSGKFDAQPLELLQVGDAMAAAIANALGATETGPHRAPLTDNRSASLYLSARANLQSDQPARVAVAIVLLEQALRLAPTDRALPPMLALAMVRHWQMTGVQGPQRLLNARKLLAQMPGQSDLPAEAYLAAGTIDHLMGDAVGAVRSLRFAIARSPSLAQAHELVGILLLDADRAADGLARLATAEKLAPELLGGRLARCQWLALQGDWAGHDAVLAEVARLAGAPRARFALWRWRLRAAMWRRDRPALQALQTELKTAGGINVDDSAMQELVALCDLALDTAPRIAPPPNLQASCAAASAADLQLRAEVAALHGNGATALLQTAAAIGLGLTATAWLRLCPLLEGLRAEAAWLALADRLTKRSVALLDAVHREATD